jgi:transcriptional regulator with XRE-family HTH domain
MSLPERLKQARETLRYTQKDLSKAVSVSVQMWRAYEAGSSVPGGNVLEALARLGFNVNWILTGEGEMRRSGSRNKHESNGEISEYAKQFLLQVIESILDSKKLDWHAFGYDPYLLDTKELSVLIYIMYEFFSRPGALIGKGNMSIHSMTFANMIMYREHNRNKTSKEVHDKLVAELSDALDFSGTGSDYLSFPIDIINELFKDEYKEEKG